MNDHANFSLFFMGDAPPFFWSFLIVFNNLSSQFIVWWNEYWILLFHLGSCQEYPHGQNWSVLMKTFRSYFHEQMPPLPLVLACFFAWEFLQSQIVPKSLLSVLLSVSVLLWIARSLRLLPLLQCCARTEEFLIFIFMVDAPLLKFVFRCFRTVWVICNSFKQTCDLWQR